jgi:peptidyl-prolyl cis-trans isomerase SurA
MTLNRVKQILIILLLIFQNSYLFGKINNSIIVKVGNEIITSIDVENEIKTLLFLRNLNINQENINRSKDYAIKALIRNSIKKSEIKKYDVQDFSQKELDTYLEKISKNLKVEKSQLKFLFSSKGIDYSIFIDRYKNLLKWNKLIFDIYKNQISLNTVEIENEIELRLTSVSQTDYNLSEIEIIITENIDEEIKEIYDSIKKIGFKDTAKKFSTSTSGIDGGNIGWISDKTINKSYLKYLNNVKTGETTKPIKQEEILTILMINDKKIANPKKMDLEKLKDLIIRQKKEEKLMLFSRSHFTSLESAILINFE